MKLYRQSTIKEMREKHGFRFSKQLGQNFLTDKNIIDKIMDGVGAGSEDTVVEIGPGMGVLTAEAAARAKRVVAIEIDSSLIPVLRETLGQFGNVEIINRDVLKTDFRQLLAGEDAEHVKIMGNLPYYITTPIIMKLLEEEVNAESITVMMQKEVADRINASPATKAYGALSVAVQYYCDVEKVAEAPKEAFVPRPAVDSVVLKLKIRREKRVEVTDKEMFFKCVRAGFGQRRKTLLNSLQAIGEVSRETAAESLSAAGIDASRRGETLTLEEFAKLAEEVRRRL